MKADLSAENQGVVGEFSRHTLAGAALAMTVAGETDPGGSMRAEIFARLDAHLAKSKVEVRPTRPEPSRSDRISGIARIRLACPLLDDD